MALKGYLQLTYQNVLNLDDVDFNDFKNKQNDFPFVKLKIFASNIQLINRLNKEGKISDDKARAFIQIQKTKIFSILSRKKDFKENDLEKIINITIQKITDL